MRHAHTVVTASLALLLAGGDALAQEGEGDDATPAAPAAEAAPAKAEYGIGVRLREIFVPKGEIELFLAEAPSGVAHPGFGLEFVRRKKNFELGVGLEYENVSPDDGWYLENGDDGVTPGQFPDFVEFKDFSWFTIDVNFVFHTPINEQLAVRYGAGFGLGIVHGDALQSDSVCTGRDIQHDCTKLPAAVSGQFEDPASLPPVFPVVDLIAGLQYRPSPKVAVNLEGGLRTVFYGGLGATYFF